VADRVTIEPTRFGWISGVLILVGAVLAVVGLGHVMRDDDPLVYLAYVGKGTIVAGALAMMLAPRDPPRRIACTRDGVDWARRTTRPRRSRRCRATTAPTTRAPGEAARGSTTSGT
jgi:hypothetical protein